MRANRCLLPILLLVLAGCASGQRAAKPPDQRALEALQAARVAQVEVAEALGRAHADGIVTGEQRQRVEQLGAELDRVIVAGTSAIEVYQALPPQLRDGTGLQLNAAEMRRATAALLAFWQEVSR